MGSALAPLEIPAPPAQCLLSRVAPGPPAAPRAQYLESDGQGLVAAPVRGQHGAEKVGAVGAHQLAGVVGQHLHHAAVAAPQLAGQGGAGVRGAQRQRLAHLARAQRGGRRREAAARAGIYGDTHHNKPIEYGPRKQLLPDGDRGADLQPAAPGRPTYKFSGPYYCGRAGGGGED